MPESARHVGSGLLVVGMHRSGTSAVTEMLHRAGLAVARGGGTPDAHVTNPHGHWESRQLVALNDDLLAAYGGTWSAPPLLEPGWEMGDTATARIDRARSAFQNEHPHAPWVWKDPRNSVTLPFWRRALGDHPIVLLHRDPRPVAASLRLRDGFSLAFGIALWTRYTRATLQAAAGLPVLVIDWDEVRADPRSQASAIASWAHAVLPELSGDVEAMAAAVDSEVGDHEDHTAEALPAAVMALHDTLRQLAGAHAVFPSVRLPDPDPWADAVLEERRRLEFERDAVERGLEDRIRVLETASQTLWSPGRVARRALRQGRQLGERIVRRRPAPSPADGPWLGENLVLLVGQPRSGTTFVGRALGAHPAVAYWEEPSLLQLARVLRSEIGERSARLGESTVDPVTAESTPLRDQFTSAAADRVPLRETRQVVGDLCAAYLAGTDATLVIDKTPGAIAHLDDMDGLFPKARAIVLVRDPRDVAASSVQWIDSGGGPEWLTSAPDPVEAVARLWNLRMRIAADTARALSAERVLTVRYEDFIEQPTVVGAQLFAFIGLEWHPRCDDFLQRGAGGGLDRSRVGRWKAVLTPGQEATVLSLNSRLMETFGYESTAR